MMDSLLTVGSLFTLMTFSIFGVIAIAFTTEEIYSRWRKNAIQESVKATSEKPEEKVWEIAA